MMAYMMDGMYGSGQKVATVQLTHSQEAMILVKLLVTALMHQQESLVLLSD